MCTPWATSYGHVGVPGARRASGGWRRRRHQPRAAPSPSSHRLNLRLCRRHRRGSSDLTIVYDNISGTPATTSHWGFAALVEYGGHTLLFDTGADGAILLQEHGATGCRSPLHRGRHPVSRAPSHDTGGLQALLDTGVRPTVYPPAEFADAFKEQMRTQTELVEVTDAVEVIPGVHTTRPVGRTTEEALVVESGDGAVVITGRAHRGVAEMVRQGQAVTSSQIAYLVGGLHLFQTPSEMVLPNHHRGGSSWASPRSFQPTARVMLPSSSFAPSMVRTSRKAAWAAR